MFTIDGFKDGILDESIDELGLEKKDFEDFKISESIVSVYGDLVEGGKPHFVFYLKSNRDSEYIKERFLYNTKNELNNKQMRVDGKRIHFLHKNKLNQIYISPDLIELDGKQFITTPSISASVVMFINYLKTRNNR